MVQLKQIESATEEEKQTAKDWQQVEEIIRGNPYREAVKNEGIAEGRESGIKLAKKIFKLSQKGYTTAQIAQECNIEESEVKEILA